MESTEKHHVAWSDRIGMNKTWAKNILTCNESYGSPGYIAAVECLRNSLINIKNGPQLKNIIDTYKNGDLEVWKEDQLIQWKNDNPKYLSNHGRIEQLKKDINYKSFEMLYNYIVQTLEDYGFCFYESNLDTDEIGLDD